MSETQKKLAENVQQSARCINIVFGTIALIIATVMCIVYSTKLSMFDDDKFICMAMRGPDDDLETVDVGEKW